MSFPAPRGSISILAPMVKKVRWHCDLSGASVDFNLWAIQQLTLQTAEGQGHLPSLHIHATARFYISLDEEDIMTPEIEKHMVAEFSALELHLKTNGHVFGAFAFHLLGMNRICSAMQRLKVVLQRSEVEETCSPHCPCDSTDWRSQTISLAALEEVEIDGFGGDHHEIDFLKLIFTCAPLLKRVTVKLSNEASSSDNGCTNIYNIFKAHSSVELYVYPSSDYKSELISISLL
ncbi:hypothetical protein VPH35_132757 [Triticum aestivum]|uniref:uncharacterized protein n=1 Tax=Triticum aestivum TaxID=4565 RepID=UPI00016ED205|nr:uncharacterized protein LOC123159073 [Triticum aestivum]